MRALRSPAGLAILIGILGAIVALAGSWIPSLWADEVASVQAQGFALVSIPMGEITQRIGELDSSRPVACLCHHGARSMRVAQFLAQQGFEQVANIAGGIDAWTQERDPSVPRY